MSNSRAIPFLFLLLLACTDERGDRVQSVVAETPTVALPPEPDPSMEDPFGGQDIDRIDLVRPTSTPSSDPIVAEPEGCSEFTQTKDGLTTVTLYIPQRKLEASNEAIRSQVSSAYHMAEQRAPRSISCNFEQGTSIEHIHMPDTLAVLVKIFERCSAVEPHTIQHYGAWRITPEELHIALR